MSSIPPIGSTPPFPAASHDPTVQRFNQLWNDWFNDPTRQSGEKLLDFIKIQHNHFEKLSKQTPEPQPKVPFDHSYDAACGSLQSWMDNGCDPGLTRAASEYVADVAKWVNYAG